MRRRRTSWLFLLAFLGACGDSGTGTGPSEPEDVTFAPSLGIDLGQMTRLSSGVYVRTITSGTGDRQLSTFDDWTIEYVFWLPDGTLVEQGPLRSELDCNPQCIRGFEEGIIGLRVGEVRMIVIPSRLAYGGSPPAPEIPPHAVLVYRVTLVGLR